MFMVTFQRQQKRYKIRCPNTPCIFLNGAFLLAAINTRSKGVTFIQTHSALCTNVPIFTCPRVLHFKELPPIKSSSDTLCKPTPIAFRFLVGGEQIPDPEIQLFFSFGCAFFSSFTLHEYFQCKNFIGFMLLL